MPQPPPTGGGTGTAVARDSITNSPEFQAMARQLGYASTNALTGAQWVDVQYHLHPDIPLPEGVHVEDGHVIANPNTAGKWSMLPFWVGVGIVGGAIAWPYLAGGGAAGGGGGAAAGGGSAAGDGALASTTIGTGAVATPAAGTSGLVSGGVATGGTAGGTVAGTAGGGSMLGNASLWSQVIGQGAGLAGSIYASKKQGDAVDAQIAASKEAALIQAQSNREALDFLKQQYSDEQGRLTPFRTIGTEAAGKLASLYGLAMPPASSSAAATPTYRAPNLPPTVPMPAPGQSTVIPAFGQSPSSTLGAMGGALVTVQAPTGETKQMSRADAEPFVAAGARIVQ